ncbi:MAG: hypothetical protein A2845_00290 [Candidatus Lloydbacteria bacterium RIFCSPHIGHO2_01_FULL_49_22]|uniref:CheW-like domain-containing protein n=1 Tax=Candidatus Lloydbacteria bacterium RIFCSPHIGHO2_01_FULL_49_22 TaxID=1798658 RepID=A0A1G2CYE6_9BACT|nr:MAG: hypothetical protein A2845_00290 [Candidatus Lloydbacteria bacterium RIFCSPHIGHO2_01_FULL_49_22]OGZ09303.1 MAG: hypothetical protein A3C14_05195 [Candidatus Lloydbacteria bacterium RIFCSPHIGHO2_02_FULL_50_18]
MKNPEYEEGGHDEKKDLFLFELDGDLYAVPVELVDRVMKIPPITPIPNAPAAIVGIFHLRGKVVLTLDLSSRMGISRMKPLSQNFLFVVRYKNDQFAILIDTPKVIVHIPASEIHRPDSILTARLSPQYVQGTFMFQEVTKVKVPNHSIFIEHIGGVDRRPEEIPPSLRPVLLLDLERVLDQEDLQHMFISQE